MQPKHKYILIGIIVLILVIFIIMKWSKLKALSEAAYVYSVQATGGTVAITNYFGKTGQLGDQYPLGIRNNNPGNVRKYDDWLGELSGTQTGQFLRFKSWVWGVRCLLKDIRSKIAAGNNTPLKIFTVYAPAADNNAPGAYAATVADALGITTGTVINANDKGQMFLTANAICRVENGSQYKITQADFDSAWSKL